MEDSASFIVPMLSVLGLIAISAFFSGSETGLTSVTRAKIHKLKMEGNRRAAIVSLLREDKERLIGAILLGNNVVNIAASAIATALAIKYLGENGVVYATAIMTVLVLVFAEVLPKTYAVRHAERVALAVAPLFVLITKVLAPFTMAVQLVVNAVISLFSSNTIEDMSGVEVLRGAVEMYHEEGGVLKEDKDMLSGIFDLEDTDVEDIMVHRTSMITINADQPVSEIIRFAANSTHTRIPLWRDSPDNVIGVIHIKDMFRASCNHEGSLDELDITRFIRKPWFVPETTTLKNQLRAFRERQKHIALVVDEFGGITGLITLEDILEEVVGEIEDEHDRPDDQRMRHFKDGSHNMDGDVTIRDVNRELGWSLSDDDAITLAGFIIAQVQRIPETGEKFEIGEYKFKVLKRSQNQLTRIKVRKISS